MISKPIRTILLGLWRKCTLNHRGAKKHKMLETHPYLFTQTMTMVLNAGFHSRKSTVLLLAVQQLKRYAIFSHYGIYNFTEKGQNNQGLQREDLITQFGHLSTVSSPGLSIQSLSSIVRENVSIEYISS